MLSHRIPPATREKLANPAPPGKRHRQIIDIVTALTSRGWLPQKMFELLRPRYESGGPHPVTDKEIWSIIEGAQTYEFLPQHPADRERPERRLTRTVVRTNPGQLLANVQNFVGEFRFAEADYVARSPIRPPHRAGFAQGAALLVANLFKRDERVNVVWNSSLTPQGKAAPQGFGITIPSQAWLLKFAQRVPQGRAGAWIRINPLDGHGIANKNVTAYRYVLVECDALPLDLQLAMLAKLGIPIAAVVTSGGRSVHAWVKVDAPNGPAYAEAAADLLRCLAPLGVDQGNKNPSRLARLPGAVRRVGAVGDGCQRLLFLNPDPRPDLPIANHPTQL